MDTSTKFEVTATYTVTVPPGTYYLCDPCYVCPDEQWMDLLDSCGFFGLHTPGGPVGTLPTGGEVVAFSTAYGDGVYYDDQGNEFGVDAGMIGLTPVDAVPAPKYDNLLKVTFDRPQTCTVEGGVLVFGPHRIDTDPAPEDDPDYEDPWT